MGDTNNKVNGLNMNPIIRKRLSASSLNAINESINKSILRTANSTKYKDYDAAKKDYEKNNVLLNDFDTSEELQLERAKNQSKFEQFGNFAVQSLGNEIVLGTIRGFSDLFDAIVNIGNQEPNDYTNPMSKSLEDAQNWIREEYAIHQKDPNKSFAIGDFGWWMSNAVSVASTVSLLLPSMGVTKGISTLSKIGNIGTKTSMGLAKVAKKLGATKSATRLASSIENIASIGTNAVLSRTMEGYLEARGVYNEVYEDILSNINSMSEEDKIKFIERNPQLANKSNEDIAKYIAGESADTTFRKDYTMLLMDFMQLKAIGSLWKGMPNKAASRTLRQMNTKAIGDLVGETTETTIKQSFGKTFLKNRLDDITEIVKHPLTSIGGLELGEGFEEGFQGIATEKGKEVGKMYLDPNYTPRTIASYLADSEIWEQAFWGALGGIAFQKVGTALGNAARKIEARTNKDKLSETDINELLTSEEKIRAEEINGRATLAQEFIDNMNTLNNYQSVDEYEDKEKTIRKRLTKEEAEIKKEEVLNDYVSKLVMNAVDKGNYELLMEYVQSNEFDKHFKDLGIGTSREDRTIQQAIISKAEQVYNTYSDNLYNILTNTEIENQGVIRAAAHQLTRESMYVNDLQARLDILDQRLSDLNNSPVEEINAAEARFAQDYINDAIRKLDKAESEAFEDYNNGKITKQAYDAYHRAYEKRRNSLNELVSYYDGFDYLMISDEVLPTEVENTLKSIVYTIDALNHAQEIIPKSKQDYLERTEELAIALDKLTQDRLSEAAKQVEDYIKSQENLEQALDDVMRGNVRSLKNALDILKLGHHSTADFAQSILATVKEEDKARKKRATEEEIVRIDGNEVSEEQKEEIRESVIEAEDEVVNLAETSPSTGEVTQLDPNKLAAAVIGDEIDTDQLDKATRQYIEQQKEDPNVGVAGTAQGIVMNLYKTDYRLIEAAANNDKNSIEFKALLDAVTDVLINERGVHPDVAKANVVKGVQRGLKLVATIANKHNDKIADKLAILAESIAAKTDYRNGMAAMTVNISNPVLNEIIKEFIEDYVKYKGIVTPKGQKTVINIEKLLYDIIHDEEIGLDIETAMYVMTHIGEFVNNSFNKDYIFIKAKNFNKYVNNPQLFYADLREARSETIKLGNYIHAEVSGVSDNPLSGVMDGDNFTAEYHYMSNGNPYSISFKKNGKEVAYLSMVNRSETGNELSIRVGKGRGGIQHSVRQIGDNYVSNIDWFINELFKQDGELWNMFNEYYRLKLDGINPDTAWFMKFMNNPQVKKFIDEGYVIFPTQSVENKTGIGDKYVIIDKAPKIGDKAKIILNGLIDVIFYDKQAQTPYEFKYSYKQFLANYYKNAEITFQIQEELNRAAKAGENPKINVSLEGRSNLIDSKRENNLNITEEERDIDQLKGLSYDKNPIVAFKLIDGNVRMVNEMTKSEESIDAPFDYGNMGFLIGGNPNSPLVALFSSANHLTESLNKQLQKELFDILEGFQDGNITYEQVYDSLSQLFNGPGIKHPTIFAGYSLIENGTQLAIVKNDDSQKTKESPKYVLIINKYQKDSDKRSSRIVYRPQGNKEGASVYNKKDIKGIDKIVKEIADNVVYNKTFFTLDHMSESNTSDNKYMYKENGKFVINIGVVKTIYTNFGEFVLKNNAFKTRQNWTSDKGFYLTDDVNSVYLKIEFKKPQKVEEKFTTSIKDFIINTKDTKKNEKDSIELFEMAGVPQEQIDLLNGKNPYRIKLISSTFGFDDSIPGNAAYKRGKVVFSQTGANIIQNRPSEVVRLMIHESLHQRLDKLKTMQRKSIVEDLFDVYDETLKAIENTLTNADPNSDLYKYAERAKKYITQNNFTYEGYFTNFDESGQEYYNSLSEQERREIFAEEWLTESLSVSHLINFMNEASYSKEDVSVEGIKKEDKSILQKIIDILLKIFGINNQNIKNNSILAREYQILADKITPDSNIETQEITESEINEEVEEEEYDEDDDIYEIYEKLAVTEDIDTTKDYIDSINNDGEATAETFGVTRVTNMNNYLNMYEEQDRAMIKEMIDNGTLNYLCAR